MERRYLDFYPSRRSSRSKHTNSAGLRLELTSPYHNASGGPLRQLHLDTAHKQTIQASHLPSPLSPLIKTLAAGIGEQMVLPGIMRLVAAAQTSGSRAQALADRAAALLFYIAVAAGVDVGFCRTRFWYIVASGSGISRETSRIYFWNLTPWFPVLTTAVKTPAGGHCYPDTELWSARADRHPDRRRRRYGKSPRCRQDAAPESRSVLLQRNPVSRQ
jgi:hypothetical protein